MIVEIHIIIVFCSKPYSWSR